MKIFNKLLFFFLILILVSCNNADELEQPSQKYIDNIKILLKEKLPGSVSLISIEKTDINGFYEVNFEDIEPLYVSEDGKYLISGDIFEISEEGLINKSSSRRNYQRKKILDEIDEKEFIAFTPEVQKFSVYVFTDVDCGYCRQFHRQINEYLELGIRVNYLAFPRAGIGSASFRKIVSAWCSEDPNLALTNLKLGLEIEENICVSHPVEKHFGLGGSLGVNGTPSIITEEGQLIPGYLPPKELIAILET